MKKKGLILAAALVLLSAFVMSCAGAEKKESTAATEAAAETTEAAAETTKAAEAGTEVQEAAAGYSGIDVESPEWVAGLEAAKDADQMLVVAAFSPEATDAWISLHEKQSDGSWHMVMTTPGFIGKNGLGKTKEGDAKTPTGVFHFNRAFGIADDPGCAIPYVKVDEDTYWSGDPREGFHYNELVNLKDLPDLDVESGDSEHIIDYIYHYQYCLNISYNEEGTPGLGSAIFLHCFGPAKPFTGGCVAIPEDYMKFVMQRVDEKTAVVIDSYETLAGTDEWPDSTWPQVR
ncbi:MAG: L,D-transpeptidase family protein [Lachnospiraceae bacterium]|nr:L,D-transpeptidase family protein [Lachnospiraceae bacterium]